MIVSVFGGLILLTAALLLIVILVRSQFGIAGVGYFVGHLPRSRICDKASRIVSAVQGELFQFAVQRSAGNVEVLCGLGNIAIGAN